MGKRSSGTVTWPIETGRAQGELTEEGLKEVRKGLVSIFVS